MEKKLITHDGRRRMQMQSSKSPECLSWSKKGIVNIVKPMSHSNYVQFAHILRMNL